MSLNKRSNLRKNNVIVEVVVTSAAEVLMISGHTDKIHPVEPSTQHKAGKT